MDSCHNYKNDIQQKPKEKTIKYKTGDVFKGKNVKNKNKVIAIIKKKDTKKSLI